MLHFFFLSCPGWRKCEQVYEDACNANHTQAYQILQQSQDSVNNKWVPVFLYMYLCVRALVGEYIP